MGSASDLNSPKNTNIVGAGVAGGGVGTLIAAFAESLPDDTGFKSILTISAPLITIAISGIWLFFKACLLYTSPSPRDLSTSRMPSSA